MQSIRNFLKVDNPLSMFLRMNHSKHNKKFLYKDGKIVNGNIYYYPRKEDEVDPEVTPAKLFRISRTKPIKGNPYWERQILREFGLYGRPNVAIVKNIPENNARLWKIKHLIKITPINFPNGEPTAEDINYTHVKENGDCIVIKNIETLNKRLDAAENFAKDKKVIDSQTVRKDSRLKWVNSWD